METIYSIRQTGENFVTNKIHTYCIEEEGKEVYIKSNLNQKGVAFKLWDLGCKATELILVSYMSPSLKDKIEYKYIFMEEVEDKQQFPTRVVNLKFTPYNVYIGRAGKGEDGYFGNPFKIKPGQLRGSTLEKYKVYFNNRMQTDNEFKQRILNLKGKTLGCFCKPHACHGDIIK